MLQHAGVWGAKDELPIEIDLGANSRYHSIFACPILRQQTSDHNPPLRLTCGHCISRDALNKLSSGHKLKCPYCPVEQNPNDARQIVFWLWYKYSCFYQINHVKVKLWWKNMLNYLLELFQKGLILPPLLNEYSL